MRGHQAEDLTGRRFGNLLVIGRAPNQISVSKGKVHQKAVWYCQCDCGSPVKTVRAGHLKSGKIISCGCLGMEHSAEAKEKHGQAHTRLYGVWQNMKNRCNNKNVRSYKDYGGRGIFVCAEWKNNFQAFFDWAMANGYEPHAEYGKCTIDRIDNNGPYTPQNCRFVDAKVQANNRKR